MSESRNECSCKFLFDFNSLLQEGQTCSGAGMLGCLPGFAFLLFVHFTSRYSLLVRVPDSWSKGCAFESQQEWREHFLLKRQLCVLTLILCPFHLHVTTVAHKRSRSFCQKCRWQVTPNHPYTLDLLKLEWADYAAVQAECGNLSGNELTRNSSGVHLVTVVSAHWATVGLILAWRMESACASLISMFKTKHRREMNCWTFSQNALTWGKSHQTTTCHKWTVLDWNAY